MRSNEILAGLFKLMTSEGRDGTTHHSPVEPADLRKLAETGVIDAQQPSVPPAVGVAVPGAALRQAGGRGVAEHDAHHLGSLAGCRGQVFFGVKAM